MVINEIPNDVKPKVSVFLDAVKDSFSFLKDYNFKFKEARIATEYVVDNIIEVTYKNDKLDRLIVIHYEPFDIDEEEINNISITLYNGDKSEKNRLEFDLFIEKYNSDFNTDILNDITKNNKESFKENMKGSISGYAYFLKDVGENLIKGKEWEDGLIYDWSSAEDILYKAQKDTLRDKDNEDA